MDEGTRINRYISQSGVCSRREADRLIEEGRVTIDGRTAVLGDRVTEGIHQLFETGFGTVGIGSPEGFLPDIGENRVEAPGRQDLCGMEDFFRIQAIGG